MFLTKLLTAGILFSTTVNADFVAKPGILFSNSMSLVFLQDQLHQEFSFVVLICLFDIWFSKQID